MTTSMHHVTACSSLAQLLCQLRSRLKQMRSSPCWTALLLGRRLQAAQQYNATKHVSRRLWSPCDGQARNSVGWRQDICHQRCIMAHPAGKHCNKFDMIDFILKRIHLVHTCQGIVAQLIGLVEASNVSCRHSGKRAAEQSAQTQVLVCSSMWFCAAACAAAAHVLLACTTHGVNETPISNILQDTCCVSWCTLCSCCCFRTSRMLSFCCFITRLEQQNELLHRGAASLHP